MTITAQNATFSFAPQDAKIDEGGSFTIGDLDWYRHKALAVNMGPIQNQPTFPLEVGGAIVPTGAYKSAKFYAGTVSMLPRLEGSMGWLLQGLMGDVSSVPNQPVASVNSHYFRLNPSNHGYTPWMALRSFLPGGPLDGSEDFGEAAFDCKVTNLQVAFPNQGMPTFTFAFQGRDFVQDRDPAGWTYENTFEDADSCPVVGNGSLSINGSGFTAAEIPAVGAQLNLGSQFTTPDQEMIIGQFTPDDFVRLSFATTLRFFYKYENSGLAQAIFNGSPTGETWTPLPYFLETNGNNYALDLYVQSPGFVTGSTPYGMRFRANRATIAKVGPTQLAGGAMVIEEYIATVQEPASGDYLQLIVENGESSYSWPAP